MQGAKQTKGVPGITSHQGLSKYCLSNSDPTGFHSTRDAIPAGKVPLKHNNEKPTSEISALHAAAVSWEGDTSTCKSQEVLLSQLHGQGL